MPTRLDKNQRRKLSIFAKCLLFSFLAWALFAISNKYTFSKKVGLEYINTPENRAFRPIQEDSAQVKIEASGWHLLFSTLSEEKLQIQVDLSGLQTRDFIVLSNQLGFINRQFPSNERVVAVVPDTLYFDFSKQGQKQVPVRVVEQLTFAKQFGVVGDYQVRPSRVTVRGPVEDLTNIEFVETDTIKGVGLQSSLSRVVGFSSKKHGNLSYFPKAVEVEIPIGELTEKVVEVPLEAINHKAYRSVHLLPNKARLTLLVSLNDYAKIGPDRIRAVVDLNDWVPGERSTLAVQVLKLPPHVKLLHVEPQNVDFFVNK